MVPGGPRTIFPLNQYDEDFILEIPLLARDGVFTVEEGTTVEVQGTKPDGNGYSADATLDARNPVVNVQGDVQMTAAAGRAVMELVLKKDGKVLHSANFELDVARTALDKDTIASDSKLKQFADVYDDHVDEIITAGQQYAAYKAEMDELEEAATAAAESTATDKAAVAEARQSFDAASQQATSDLNAAAAAAMQQINDKAEAVAAIALSSDTLSRQALDLATNADNETAELSTSVASLRRTIQTVQLTVEDKIDGAYVENGYLYLTSQGVVVAGPLGPFSGTGGGGGGTGGNNASITVTNTTGWLSKTIADGDACPVTLAWSSVEDNMPTGNGTLTIMVNSVAKATMDIAQGDVTVDLSRYLSTGSNIVKVSVADVYGNSRTINFTVTCVSLSISSTFDASTPYTGAISFPYTPVGSIQKTIHFKLDGAEIASTTTSVSGRQMSQTIPQQRHGAHRLEVYFDCDINGQVVESNHLYFEIICLESLNTTPIIVSSFNRTTARQYETLNIDYTIYDPTSATAPVEIQVNGVTVADLTVDRTQQTFTFRADRPGTLNVSIITGNVTKSLTLTVSESDIQVEAETDKLMLFLSSAGRSNNEAAPGTWESGDIQASLTGFNWTSDGWQSDEDGITVLRVGGDARVSIPYKPFASDFRTGGKTIEVEFATRDVMNYDTPFLTCMSGGRGMELTPQLARLASEQSEISMQYKENEHVRIAFVVEKRSENRLIYIYVNGIMSGAIQYPDNDDFAQASPVDMSIGTNDCTVDLYTIRVYDNDLTRHQLLDNWIADTQIVDDMLERYQRNAVYDEYGKVVIAQLPSGLPYMIIECEETPQYKGDKKTCNITYVDPVNPSRSFTATGVQIDVQGTSSQYYPRKNYKAKFKSGFLMNNGTLANAYPLRPGAIATNSFCFKADVASSEGVNNVELARLYNDACPYKTPAQQQNDAIRQGIDGFPIVVFWHDTVNDTTTFLGKYNFNNDKGAEEVFGFVSGDESWEIKNNTSDRVLWKSDDFVSTMVDEDGKTIPAWLND
jgi:hypothetical protein